MTTDLLNRENLKVANAQLCNELLVCNSFQFTTDLLNSNNLKVAIMQLFNELQVWNFAML